MADTDGRLQVLTLFKALCRRYPGRFQPGQLRTLQRRVRDWRVQYGPDREVYFEQVAVPGREAAFDFTDASDLGVTIRGVPFPHLLFEWVLSYSKWTYVGLALSETFEALVAGLQGALWMLGAVPALLRHDNLSAATHELKRSGGRQLTARFRQVLDHYGLGSSRIRAGEYEFVFAANGVEALARLREDDEIDVVVSDINMPQMDGLTLLKQIPKVDPDIRAVVVSAYGDMKNIRTAMNRGAFDFVTKPIDFDDLTATLDRTIRHVTECRRALSMRDKLVSLQNELDMAARIQRSVLPSSFPSEPGFEVFARMVPAETVGGDFYEVIRLDGKRIGVAVADVCGKSVSAAMLMMATCTLLKGAAYGHPAPEAVLDEIDELLKKDEEDARFVTMVYGVYNPATGTCRYASAGHPAPLLVRAGGDTELLPIGRTKALGIPATCAWHTHSVTLESGDTLLFYSDGVTEAMDGSGRVFGSQRLQEVFAAGAAADEDPNQRVLDAIEEFAGGSAQSDDITCLSVRRR